MEAEASKHHHLAQPTHSTGIQRHLHTPNLPPAPPGSPLICSIQSPFRLAANWDLHREGHTGEPAQSGTSGSQHHGWEGDAGGGTPARLEREGPICSTAMPTQGLLQLKTFSFVEKSHPLS